MCAVSAGKGAAGVIYFIGAALLLAVGLFLWWLFIITEGVYLGRRVVIWLYDLYAGRYDNIKQFQPEYDHVLLAQPIMEIIAPHQSPLVLDVATGTGRLPDALLNHVGFHGRIVAADLSHKMLVKASEKLADDLDRVTLLCVPAEDLPFEDDLFDVVTCLEALEFMAEPVTVLCELARVLRPGGLLVTTNRIGTRLMPGKTFTDAEFEVMLNDCGIEDVIIEPWQEDYHRVWGLKAGEAMPTGARPFVEILRAGVHVEGDQHAIFKLC